jgi:Protein of unknown function (DUF2971)
MSDDHTNNEANEKPKYLYRYCSASRALQILAENRLYLCAPNKFNDVFEGATAPLVQYQKAVVRECTIRQHLFWGTWVTREEAEWYVDNHESFEEQCEHYSSFVSKLREVANRMRQHSGITCLSSAFNHQKMWGTYGDNHSGVCIQFWRNGATPHIHKHAVPVTYTKQNWAEAVIGCVEDDGTIPISVWCGALFLRKTPEWADEHEWRILTVGDSPISEDQRQWEFPADNIRRVFLGPRIKPEQRDAIYELAGKNGHIFSVQEVDCDPDTGVSAFKGVDVVLHRDDLDWHLQLAMPTPRHAQQAVQPDTGKGGDSGAT